MKLMYSSIVLQVGIFYLLSVCLPSIEIIVKLRFAFLGVPQHCS